MTIKILGAEWEGVGNPPRGANSHTEGLSTIASNSYAHAEGQLSNAAGNSSHAEGQSTTASSSYAHAEGGFTMASASCAHAEGYNTTANGGYSHAEGSSTTASAVAAHAEGLSTTASGSQAHAEGGYCKATGSYTHAGGTYATADAFAQWARGSVNPALWNSLRLQVGIYTSVAYTTSTAATTLTIDGTGTPNATSPGQNVVLVPTKSTVTFEVLVTARRYGSTGSQGWVLQGMAYNESGTATIAGVNNVSTTWYSPSTLGTVTVTASGNYIAVVVTPSAINSTIWHAVMTTNELVASA